MACELLNRPDLNDKPACVGRGMILTSNYVARRYGVRSAMPMYQALKLCPSAVVITGNIQKYKKVSVKLASYTSK